MTNIGRMIAVISVVTVLTCTSLAVPCLCQTGDPPGDVARATLPAMDASSQPAASSTEAALQGEIAGPRPLRHKVEELHPAFILTVENYAAAQKLGMDTARKGKTWESLLDPYKRIPRWVRGKNGKAKDSAVWCLNLGGVATSLSAYQSAAMYQPIAMLPKEGKDYGAHNYVVFEVLLSSMPRYGETDASTGSKWAAIAAAVVDPNSANSYASNVRTEYELKAAADERDVRVIKFVLSDDKGHDYEAEQSGTKTVHSSSGMLTSSGVNVIPQTVTGRTTAEATGRAYGGGSYVTMSARGSERSTYTLNQYVPWSENHPYYQARYFVTFPLFDKDGHAQIARDVKEITLRIITETGEQDVTYKLPAPREDRH